MSREIEQPTVQVRDDDDKWGAEERHPAWGLISAHRVQGGAHLFDSDIEHQHYVNLKISRASRRRSLNRDWLSDRETLISVDMSEAQWASAISSMNQGQGTPCTIERVQGERMPGMPHEPRLAESMKEVRDAGEKALQHIREAFAAVEEKPNKGNIRHLKSAIENAPGNMVFAAKSLTEHAENVVQRSKADVEAMVASKAAQMGMEPGDLGVPSNLLDTGEES